MEDGCIRDIGRRYRIVDTLGKGGMGTVYRAKDRLGGFVALKQITATSEDQSAMVNAAPAVRRIAVNAPTIGPFEEALGVAHAVTMAAPIEPTMPPGHHESGVFSGPTLVSTGQEDSPTSTSSRNRRNPALSERTHVADVLRLTLAREFRVLSALRHPNIISVLDYGFDEELNPYFTMELIENGEPVREAGRDRPFEQKLDFLVQILHALAYLHRRGVIHRDLKPSNVLVAGDRVKVLDFGVSILGAQGAETGKGVTGTVPYMAPELLRMSPANELSDLYAVGMIAYELFSGTYPFNLDNLHVLTHEITTKKPDFRGLDPRVVSVIERLLEKDPKRRYGSVVEVLAALNATAGIPLAIETVATRESFLQAAELVGRATELNELSRLLADAMGGRGGGVLIGGESGVGKSRLLEELRARALVDGALVLRGQEVSEGGGPYHVFRDILRWLALSPNLANLEASVLKPLVPDIAALLERDVPDPPELDADAAQARFVHVVEDLLARQEHPVVMILEDIHWAGTDSLKLLARIARTSAEQHLLIIASYRDDERADLPSEVPGMHVLKLHRLTKQGIAKLSASMLGEAGCLEEVLSLLQRETEGNPFFLVEAVRALAEDAGGLGRVGMAPLPSKVFAGGVHLIVRRRLNHVPPSARPLLQAAAVMGRELDFKLLRQFEPEADLDRWLQACGPVLDVVEERFRFAHDKLREGLLANLSDEDRRTLHRGVAQAIEAVYPDSNEWVAALAHHWAAAGDRPKEAHYAALAGQLALQSSAYREAVAFFERALALEDEVPKNGSGQEEAANGSFFENALRELKARVPTRAELVKLSSDAFRVGLLEGHLAEAYGRQGNHAEAFKHGAIALKHLGVPMPSVKLGWVAGLAQQALIRTLQTFKPELFTKPSEDARAVILEATRIQARITETCFFTQQSLEMLWSGLHVLNMGERAGPSPELARGYVLMGAVTGIIPIHSMAEAWCRRAEELAASLGRPYDIAFVRQRRASYDTWMGRFKSAEDSYLFVKATADQAGDDRQRGDATLSLAVCMIAQGRFEESAEEFEALRMLAQRSGDLQSQCWGVIGNTLSKLRMGVAIAEEPDGALEKWIDEKGATSDVLGWYAARGMVHLRAGRGRQAEEAASKALKVALATRPVAFWTQPCLAAIAEIYLELLETSLRGASGIGGLQPVQGLSRSILEKQVKLACKAARVFGSIFPIGQPFSLLIEGMNEKLSGNPARAREALDKAVGVSRKLEMPYEEGRALFELGRNADRQSPARRRSLERAAEIFASLRAGPDLRRAEAELERA
jgi:serine/threonine protein kinase/tetratricopeptide (TPR) repeat protein